MSAATMAIARKLVELCRQGRNREAHDALYAADAVSIEAIPMPGLPRRVKGRAAIDAKGERWAANHKIHSAAVTGPWPHDKRFIVGYQYDVTNKPSGKRMLMNEVCLYTLRDGKIAREEFFYTDL